ncbi:interferon-gamma-inducible GTPase 10 isoform X2 [Oryctolagus cuniculus]|uniref:interferon-gamma-inducible GTPase 10 isoform X2 n=1 Tax=Oryctolagus cuniculus TaxID=9986 RepID=UPI00387A40A5
MGAAPSATYSERQNQDLDSSFKAYLKNCKTESKIISQETIRSIQSHLAKGDLPGAHSVISDALKNIDDIPLNIAVTGDSGSGKSSLVNTLRGIGDEGEDAAPVGAKDTTMERKPYKHPKFPSVTIWDLPGFGTPNFQLKGYLDKVKFGEYDLFIIVSASFFTKYDLELAKGIRAMKKNFYLVRTKVDFDLQNEQQFKPTTYEREKVLEEIRNNSLKEFYKNDIELQTFLISNKDSSEFDFSILMDTLLKDLPNQKRNKFMLSLPSITEAAIEKKKESLKQNIWLGAVKDGILATLPMASVFKDNDVEKLQASLHQYRVCFGVDDESLQILAKDLRGHVEELKAIIKSPYLLDTEQDETIGEKLLKFLDGLSSADGGLLATGLYFRQIYLQFHFLDIVANDAKVLLKEAYSRKQLTYH